MPSSKLKTGALKGIQNSKLMNYQPAQVLAPDDLLQFCQSPHLPPLDPAQIARHQADAHWLRLDARANAVARCSLWWRETPPYPGHRLGLIGHYAASDEESAAQLLAWACRQLAERGCTLAVGPMDGNTWRSYRLVTEWGSQPPFFLEPHHPAEWPAHFLQNGFGVLSEYCSTLTPGMAQPQPGLKNVAARVAGRGITFHPFNPDCFSQELNDIYAVALASFSHNFLYTPISSQEFAAMYRPLQPHLQPQLILIARQESRPVGFCFALPDLLQARRGHPIDAIIIKTVAVHPHYQTLGLGSLLVARCQQIAYELGYTRAIHALMHRGNASRKISRRHQAQTIRRYALFAKQL